MEKFGSFNHQLIDLVANAVWKSIPVANGSSFVLNSVNNGSIQCRVNGKEFTLRLAQVNDFRGEKFDKIELKNTVTETIDIRFGVDGALVYPPSIRSVNVDGSVNATLSVSDYENIATHIQTKTPSTSLSTTADVTIGAGATVTVIAAATGVKNTLIVRTDNNSDIARAGEDVSATKGCPMPRDSEFAYDGGGACKIYNPSGSPMTVSITREVY